MIMFFQLRMLMTMRVLIPAMDVGMAVGMAVRVCMNEDAVTMGVIVLVGMYMGMLQGNGISNHQYCGADHDRQTKVKPDAGNLAPKEYSEQDT